jgi:outer membrane protein TolC
MRLPSLSHLLAALVALPSAAPSAFAQAAPEAAAPKPESAAPAPPPAAPPAPVAPTAAQTAKAAHSPHKHPERAIDAPTPSMEDIAHAFDPLPNGLTSEEIVKLALVHSPELKKAELSEDTAKANKARASIAFAPRIDLQAKYTHLSKLNYTSPLTDLFKGLFALLPDPGAGGGNQSVSFAPLRNQYYTQLGISLPVTDMFLTVIPQYKGAAAAADVAVLRKQASELQVSFDARSAFYQYAHVIGAVIVAQRAVQLYEANVKDLEALVQAGTATETDLIRARSELEKMKVHVVEFSGQQDVALARLAIITGTEMDAGRGIGEPFVGIEMSATPDVIKLADDAKRSRPEVAALRKLEEARIFLAKSRRGAQYPQLKGFFNGYYANPNPRIIPPQQDWYASWDVGVSLAYSPNDSIYAHTQYKDSLTELASVREDLRLVEDGIDMEAAQAVTTHRAAVANTQASTASLEAARRYQSDQRELLLAGAATPNDVLEAQLLLTRAALEWVDSFISVRMAEAALLKAQGKTGLSAQGPQVSRSSP